MTRVHDLTNCARILGFSLSISALGGCGSSEPAATSTSVGGTAASVSSSSSVQGGSQATGGTRSNTVTGGTNNAASSATGGTVTHASTATGGSTGGSAGNTGGRSSTTGGAATGGAEHAPTGGKAATGGAATTGVGGTSNVSASTGGVQATGGSSTGTTSKGGTAASGGSGSGVGGQTAIGGTAGVGGATSSTSGTMPTDAVIVPDSSWACGMSSGIPSPTKGTLVFQATLDLAGIHDVGVTQYGHRRVLSIDGGKFTGDRIQGSFLTGGLDWELTLSNGVIELEEVNILKASDGTIIYVRSCGVAPAGESVIRFVPDFEVGTSSTYSWLNTGKFVGTRTLDSAAKKLQISVYDVSNVTSTSPSVQITKPAGGTNQPWDCATVTGKPGNTVFTENVTLGSSISTGSAKRGTRNMIPITGGTTTGTVKGAILSGGADYQLASSSGTKLEARYTLAPSDGEFIVVKNCGPMGALLPQFEARADGPYKALNTPNGYVSSDPQVGSGGVSITFSERK